MFHELFYFTKLQKRVRKLRVELGLSLKIGLSQKLLCPETTFPSFPSSYLCVFMSNMYPEEPMNLTHSRRERQPGHSRTVL